VSDEDDGSRKKVLECLRCGEPFWEDEAELIREPHGELTQVCPHCGAYDFFE